MVEKIVLVVQIVAYAAMIGTMIYSLYRQGQNAKLHRKMLADPKTKVFIYYGGKWNEVTRRMG